MNGGLPPTSGSFSQTEYLSEGFFPTAPEYLRLIPLMRFCTGGLVPCNRSYQPIVMFFSVDPQPVCF